MQSLSSSNIESWLSWFLRGLLILGFLVLIGRLVDLQIIRGVHYKTLAEGNRIRRVPISAPRGRILARGGEVLVGNTIIKRRVVFDPDAGYEKVDETADAKEEEIMEEPEREYYLGSVFAHASGYLGEVDESEVGKVRGECLEKGARQLGTLVGRSGLEQQYDCDLSGVDGEELVEVDAAGNRVRTLGRREPVEGSDIKTTIHYGLQEKVAQIFKKNQELPLDRRGAVVVADTKGEVLAMYSFPSYDPNIFIEGVSESISSVLNDKSMPLFNRVISGSYHPGSIYKPMVAVAALEEGVVDEDYRYKDTGEITIDSIYGKFSYTNWYFTQYGRAEGEISLTKAIARSTDTFFYKLGELVGIEDLNKWSNDFGLDKKTGVDLPGEIAGLIPSPEWKEKVKGERWFLGNTYHMSIGQGDIALTPLGINTAIATLANDGAYCKPRIVSRSESENFQCKDLGIEGKTLELVKNGMIEACLKGGTGYTFFDAPVAVACKTGTAETDNDEATHAWFVFFAPADEPEIVTTVLVEKGGEGSHVAGPVAREVFDYWFDKVE
jgi:penicillin-binding protein 2